MTAILTPPPADLAWPTRKDENWRFGSWKEANLSGIKLLGPGQSIKLPAEVEGATRLIFENGELVSGSHKSVKVVDKSFGPQSRLGSSALAEYHQQKCHHGLEIQVSDEAFLEIIHIVSGEGLLAPSLTISAGVKATVKVIERFISADEAVATVLAAVDVNLAADAQVTYLVTQELNAQSKLIRLADSQLATRSAAKLAIVHTGARWVREETYCTVDGTDARSEIISVALPQTGQEYDQRTFQHHGARDTFSDLLFKNTLFGKAKTVFSGLIFVDEGAHGTDAYQTCRNLMMSDDGEAHSMPGLEINADGVKCSHGSTTSRVSDEEIFYLMARGITPKDARTLVAQGFSSDAIDKLEDEQMEALALEVVLRKFAAVE